MFRHLITVQQQFRAVHKMSAMLPFKCNSSSLIHQNHKMKHNVIVYQRRPISSSLPRYDEDKTKDEEPGKVLKGDETKKVSKVGEDTEPKAKTKHSPVIPAKPAQEVIPKRSFKKKIIDEIVHYYNGFRLLFVEIRIAFRLLFIKVFKGRRLSRRENQQLVQTASDILRLIPFTIILVIPFLEFLLPLILKFFPQLLPSTFETASDVEKKFRAQLRIQIQMAAFLASTLTERLPLFTEGENGEEFVTFLVKSRSSGTRPTNKQLLKFSKLFQNELKLEKFPRSSLIAFCRLFEIRPWGTNNFLRMQLEHRLIALKNDDQIIMKEGVESLSVNELLIACRARGMQTLGLSEEQLRSQLKQWLELSLSDNIPSSLLLLSRVLYIPENLDAADQVNATLSTLPDTTKAKPRKSTEKKAEEPAEKVLADKAPTEEATDKEKEATVKEKEATVKEKEATDKEKEATDKEKEELSDEKEKIRELKENMAEYEKDIKVLKAIVLETGNKELKESKVASRLSKEVNNMISKMDVLLQDLTEEREILQQQIDEKDKEGVTASKERDAIISVNELVLAIRRLQKVSDDTRLQKIVDVLEETDASYDATVEIDQVLKVIELLGKDNVKVTTEQMDEIIKLLMKVNALQLEGKMKEQKNKKSTHENAGKEEE